MVKISRLYVMPRRTPPFNNISITSHVFKVSVIWTIAQLQNMLSAWGGILKAEQMENISSLASPLFEKNRLGCHWYLPVQLLLLSWGLQDTVPFACAFVVFHSAWQYLHMTTAEGRQQTNHRWLHACLQIRGIRLLCRISGKCYTELYRPLIVVKL